MNSFLSANNKRRIGLMPLFLIMAGLLALLLAACGTQDSPNLQGAAGTGSTPTSGTPTAGGAVSFSKDVQPILQSRCINCHGGQKTQKGLDMTSYDKLMAGSENGPVVIPGSLDKSNFIQMVLQGKMPKSGPKLLPAQVQMLENWVTAGAKNN